MPLTMIRAEPTIRPTGCISRIGLIFHTYADYTRRISYMNADSRHETNVLLYYPITSIWADTAPLFSGQADYQRIGEPGAWKNLTILINDYYTRTILELSNHHWDYNIADDQYIAGARVEGNELVIGPQRFRAIILPAITTLSRTTLKKLEEFHQAGGIILAYACCLQHRRKPATTIR